MHVLLANGQSALIDDLDYPEISKYRWHCSRGYVMRSVRNSRPISMHRQIIGAPEGVDVDHINGNTLDNRRCNLRLCSASQNLQNMKRHRDGSSRFKGVSWHKQNRNWRATIRANGKWRHLGSFDNEVDAAKAYNLAASEYFGEFAKLNLGI